jgi:four helix bundle protein
MEDNPIVKKSFAFALRVIKLCRYLAEEHKEFALGRELSMSGTGIGKYVKMAVSGESRESFIRNMAKALQDADLTDYWLSLIHFGGYINIKEYDSMEADRKELAKMLNNIVKTSRAAQL